MKWLMRVILLIISSWLGLQIFSHGTANISGEHLQNPETTYEAINNDIYLTADARTLLAEKANEVGEFSVSEQLGIQALASNMTSGAPASYLLSFYSSQKRDKEAESIAEIAGHLWPSHTYTHTRLADYWFSQQRMDKLIPEWHILLSRNASLYSTLFPVLVDFLNQSANKNLFKPYIKNPPNWWQSFFNYLSQNAQLELLDEVYQERTKSLTPITAEEKQVYITRLLADKQWQQAYQTWQTGISEKAKNQLTDKNYVYDGGFEGYTINTGFDWQITNSKNIAINKDSTYGIKERQALHIHLKKNEPIDFQNIAQTLLLPSGHYELSMRYRLDSLKTSKGLQWRIHCLDAMNESLVESQSLQGQQSWRDFSVKFDVPNNHCDVQLLRLEASSPYRHEHYFDGDLWFDEIKIQSVAVKD